MQEGLHLKITFENASEMKYNNTFQTGKEQLPERLYTSQSCLDGYSKLVSK